MKPRAVFAVLAALAGAPAAAATMSVEGTVSPAWVERAGGSERVPLAPGMTLQNRDRVVTGAGSRALLKLADGSAVKLGENAVLNLDGLAEKQNDRARRLVTASLDVVQGAFRFTTGVFSKLTFDRDVTITISSVQAGIRGTDLWGKSDAERDLVCLLEGRISVTHAQTGQITMEEPLTFFVVPRQQAPLPVARVEEAQLLRWAVETELDAVTGGARLGGSYRVDVSASPDRQSAVRDSEALRRAGFPASVEEMKRARGSEYEVRIADLASERDAEAVAEKVKALGFARAAIGR